MARTIDNELHSRRHKQLLDAAARCYIENGFHQTSMQQICKQAKMSAGSVYHYFSNKDSIIEAISQEFSTDTRKFISDIMSKEKFVDGYLKAVSLSLKRTQKYYYYARLIVEIYAESFRNSKVKEILESLDQKLIKDLQALIKQARKSGQISNSHDVVTLAHVLISLLEGMEDRVLQYPDIKLNKLLNVHKEISLSLLEKTPLI